MTRVALVSSLAIVLLAAALSPVASSRTSQLSRVIDRTYVCTTGVQAGVRKVELHAQPGLRDPDQPGRWKDLAGVTVSTPSREVTAAGLYLLGMWAGRGGLARGSPDAGSEGEVWISPKRCRAARAQVPLSTRGLSGGPAGPFSDDYECFPPRTLIVRLRGSFRAPTRLRRNRDGLLVATSPTRVEFAMRTTAGRPFAYGSVSDIGKTRLFFVGNCVRD